MNELLEQEEGIARLEAEANNPARDITPVDLPIYDEDIRHPRKRPRDISLPKSKPITNPRVRRRERKNTNLMLESDDEEDEVGEVWAGGSNESEVLRGTWEDKSGCAECDCGEVAGLVVTVMIIALVVRFVAEFVRD
jgi:hypothetical protein